MKHPVGTFFSKLAQYALFIVFFLATLPAVLAETLVNLQDGSQVSTESLLSQKKTLIYIERDCSVCRQYVVELDKCSDAIKKKLVFVSVNSAAETKAMARKIPEAFDLYMIKDHARAKRTYTTPTTRRLGQLRVGLLKCSDI